jgi:hypothetical protein
VDLGDYFWLVWLGAFVAFEISAAIWRPRWTLSNHIWRWFAVRQLLDMLKLLWVILREAIQESFALLRWLILLGLGVSTLLHFNFGTSWVPIVVFAVGAAWSIWYHYTRELKREPD